RLDLEQIQRNNGTVVLLLRGGRNTRELLHLGGEVRIAALVATLRLGPSWCSTQAQIAALFPNALGKLQAGEIFGGKPPLRLDAEALEHRDHLPCVLGGVPGRALE